MDVLAHIKEIENAVHKINHEKHVHTADEYIAMGDLQSAVHGMRKCFEYNKGLHVNDGECSTPTAGEIIDS